MAEIAGLAVGVASLGSLFSNCIELAEYISLARNMGADYEASYTKFLILRSRLVASGTQLRGSLENENQARVATGSGRDWQEAACRILVAIKALLENVKGLESKYGLRSEGQGDRVRSELQHGHSSALQEVERSLQSNIKQRQQSTGLGRKIVWAIRDRKAFDRLISDLTFYVNELENLALSSGAATSLAAVVPELPESISPAAIRLLDAAASCSDVKEATKRQTGNFGDAITSQGHLYLRNEIKQRARVLQGDMGKCGPHSRRHVFEENVISGGSKVVQGNVACDFMDDFWKD